MDPSGRNVEALREDDRRPSGLREESPFPFSVAAMATKLKRLPSVRKNGHLSVVCLSFSDNVVTGPSLAPAASVIFA